MFTLYVIVTFLTIAANLFSAVCDFIRYEQVAIAMNKAGVSLSWMTTLGALKLAGVIGLAVGFYLRPVGIAAAGGLILFFVSAILVHFRARDHSYGLAIAFLLLAVGTLALHLLTF